MMQIYIFTLHSNPGPHPVENTRYSILNCWDLQNLQNHLSPLPVAKQCHHCCYHDQPCYGKPTRALSHTGHRTNPPQCHSNPWQQKYSENPWQNFVFQKFPRYKILNQCQIFSYGRVRLVVWLLTYGNMLKVFFDLPDWGCQRRTRRHRRRWGTSRCSGKFSYKRSSERALASVCQPG